MVAGPNMIRLEIFYTKKNILWIDRDFSVNAIIAWTFLFNTPHISQPVAELLTLYEMEWKKKEERFKSVRGTWLTIVGFEDGGNVPWAKDKGWPLEAGNVLHGNQNRDGDINLTIPRTYIMSTTWVSKKGDLFLKPPERSIALPIPWVVRPMLNFRSTEL